MKRLNFLAVATVALTMVSLTSCLKGGENEMQGAAFGVVSSSMYGETTINAVDPYKGYLGPLYSAAIQTDPKVESGGCGMFAYHINYDNQTAAQGKKYTLAAITEYTKIAQSYSRPIMNPIVPEAKTGELPIEKVGVAAFLENRLFVGAEVGLEKNQSVNYQLSYHMDSVVTIQDNQVYSLYVTALGTPSTGTTETVGSYTAFDINSFYKLASDKAKAGGKKQFQIKLKFVKATKEGTQIVYKIVEEAAVALPVEADKES